VAAGEPLPLAQDQVVLTGHAMEARVYAEDPDRGFLPTGGTVLALAEPDRPHVRVDSGLAPGMTVGSAYDPMLAKIIGSGPDRATALARLDGALAATSVLGVVTNVGYLRTLLADPDVIAGRLDTHLAERVAPAPDRGPAVVPGEVLAAAALAHLLRLESAASAGPAAGPWDIPDGWRVGGATWTTLRLTSGGGDPVPVRVRGLASTGAEVCVDGAEPVAAQAAFDGAALIVSGDGQTRRYAYAYAGGSDGRGTAWLGRDGRAWALTGEEPLAAGPAHAGRGDGVVRSPMPGTVREVRTARGDQVKAGQPLLIVEAMKMEHTVSAPADGEVTELTAAVGQQVALDETLAVITPAGSAD
jgi:acetyl-CoA/propionyl-CoA carboxylase biotin carboxyl carrier protein